MKTFRPTHRLVHRSSGTLADDLMEVSPGCYATESAWRNLATVDPSTLPSFDIVPIDDGTVIVTGIDRGVSPGAPGTETRTLTSTAEEDGCCNIGPHGKHWLWTELQKLWPDIDEGEYNADAYFGRIVKLVEAEKKLVEIEQQSASERLGLEIRLVNRGKIPVSHSVLLEDGVVTVTSEAGP